MKLAAELRGGEEDIITLHVPGTPQALKRHRTYRVGTSLRQVDPSKAAKQDFLAKAMDSRPETPIQGAVSLHVTAVFERPKSHYGTGKNAKKLRDSAPSYHTSKPDADNLAKFIADSLTSIYWRDDAQISSIFIEKRYGRVAYTDIIIYKLNTP